MIEYKPVIEKEMSPLIEILESCNTDLTGADRHSELVNLIYGKYGFYFKESDEYKIRAYYIGLKNMMVPSNTLTFRVGHDPSIEKKYSNGYFSYKVGMNLYFHGSMSKSLVDGRKFLSKLAKENKDISIILYQNIKNSYSLCSYLQIL